MRDQVHRRVYQPEKLPAVLQLHADQIHTLMGTGEGAMPRALSASHMQGPVEVHHEQF